MKWPKIFYTPFPRPERNLRNVLWLGLMAFGATLFIIIFKPYDIENRSGIWYFNLVIVCLGIIFYLSIYFMEFIVPRIIPFIFRKWTFGKAVLWYTWLILFVGAVMFLSKSYFAGFRDFTWTEYLLVLGRLLGIGITVSFFVLGMFSYFNRKNFSLLASQENYTVNSPDAKPINLNLSEVMYMVSDDNYVDIHLEKEGVRDKLVFRSSLKNIEDQIVNPLTPIYRCHRRYLINITYFMLKSNTSRKTSIQLINYEDEVPVSKKYVENIVNLLQIRPK
ncbi:MAG: LytTR family transcriptional regulator [Saprospiraceae bacterium]|nr:LytTR family transcriptional regulator [Saprospiraceae bacterium]